MQLRVFARSSRAEHAILPEETERSIIIMDDEYSDPHNMPAIINSKSIWVGIRQVKKLYLHIGLPKTGSSALQTFFARNIDALGDAAINYCRDDTVEHAAEGRISSGNGRVLVRWLRPERRDRDFSWQRVEKQFFRQYFSEYSKALISSELLSSIDEQELGRFKHILDGECDVAVIALVRNVYDHCVSTWHQKLKRSGLVCELLEFAESRYNNPQYYVLSKFARVFGEERIWVLHYDSIRGGIAEAFLRKGLELSNTARFTTHIPNVNRSLTDSEVHKLQKLNSAHNNDHRVSKTMSDEWIYRNPDLDRDRTIDDAVYDRLVSRFGSQVKEINERFFGGASVLGFGDRGCRPDS